MKKYISPEMIAVELRMAKMVAQSLNRYDDDAVTEESEVLTREQTWPKNSVWDNEW
ncbi:MAG: hypothetical protein J6W52_05930 [Bacteroidaceae bacterium]|nr:hypothetical protein [Bacteroidaceae bacterium]